ncbi:MAG: hypothetical protein MK008_06825 [Bdellovibrionales bacterium]|nr:hypothetical protein [Bdellovibrionales bacterium]
MKTTICKSKLYQKQVLRAPTHIRRKISFWILEVSLHGIQETRKRPGYHDEPLKGGRKGQRSIRLSHSYRLIYRELEAGIHIHLLEVNNHDY